MTSGNALRNTDPFTVPATAVDGGADAAGAAAATAVAAAGAVPASATAAGAVALLLPLLLLVLLVLLVLLILLLLLLLMLMLLLALVLVLLALVALVVLLLVLLLLPPVDGSPGICDCTELVVSKFLWTAMKWSPTASAHATSLKKLPRRLPNSLVISKNGYTTA
jgi:hypothetical protein